MAGSRVVALFMLAGAVTGCGSTDCNDTATCLAPGDDAAVSRDAFVDTSGDEPAAMDGAADARDHDVIMADSNDDTLETGSGDADAADDVIDATADASDGDTGPADTGPPPADGGMNDADAGVDAPPDVVPPPKCKSNVLVPRAAAASSFNDPNVAAQGIDANFGTRWESAWGVDPQWIYVDFGAPVFISRVQILWLRSCAVNYDLQVSNSTTGGWMTIRSIVGNSVGSSVSPTDWTTAVDHAGLSGVGRYLRVFGKTRCDTNYGYSLWEIQVSGDTNPICTP